MQSVKEGLRTGQRGVPRQDQISDEIDFGWALVFLRDIYLLELERLVEQSKQTAPAYHWNEAQRNVFEKRYARLQQENDRDLEFFLDRIPEIWQALETVPNRTRVVGLLIEAYRAAAHNLRYGSEFWKETKKQRTRLQKRLKSSHQKVHATIDKAIEGVKAYLEVARQVETYSYPLVLSMLPVLEGGSVTIGEKYPQKFALSKKIEKLLRTLQQAAESLRRIPDPVPGVKKERGSGRPKDPIRSITKALFRIFLKTNLPENKAMSYAHHLIYLLGISDNPNSRQLARVVSS